MTTSDDAIAVRWPSQFNQIPKDIFHREDVYRRELALIFDGPQWHPVAHVAEVPQPGSFKTIQIGERPVLVLRGDDDRVRVFENSCPHRGTTLETCARGQSKRIQCPYHRWTFSTNGELMGVPGVAEFPAEFRKEDHGLKVLRSAQAHGVVFATFDPSTPPLEEYLGDTAPYIGTTLAGDGRLKLLGYQKVIFNCNWKEYNDNDGYHGPLLHAAFRLLQLSAAEGVQFMTTYAHKVNASALKDVPDTGYLKDFSVLQSRDPKSASRSTIVSLFPLGLFTRHLDVINIRFAFPLSADVTEVHYAYFSHEDDDEELVRHRVRQSSNLIGPSGLISLEDGAVFNRLHVGARSTGTVGFQKGVKGRIEAPYELDKGEEAGNLIRWEHYRKIMGFEREL